MSIATTPNIFSTIENVVTLSFYTKMKTISTSQNSDPYHLLTQLTNSTLGIPPTSSDNTKYIAFSQ